MQLYQIPSLHLDIIEHPFYNVASLLSVCCGLCATGGFHEPFNATWLAPLL